MTQDNSALSTISCKRTAKVAVGSRHWTLQPPPLQIEPSSVSYCLSSSLIYPYYSHNMYIHSTLFHYPHHVYTLLPVDTQITQQHGLHHAIPVLRPRTPLPLAFLPLFPVFLRFHQTRRFFELRRPRRVHSSISVLVQLE